MSMIKIQKLIHDYIKRDDEGNAAGTVRAIDGVDLEVKPGQFIAVLGHNGSGKSTKDESQPLGDPQGSRHGVPEP